MTITRRDAYRIGVASEVVDTVARKVPFVAGVLAVFAFAGAVTRLWWAGRLVTAPASGYLLLCAFGWPRWVSAVAVTAPYVGWVLWWVRRERRSAATGGSEAPPSITDLSRTAWRMLRIRRRWERTSASCRLIGTRSRRAMRLFHLRGTTTGVTARVKVCDGLVGEDFEDRAERIAADINGCRLVEVTEATPMDGHPDLINLSFVFGDELVLKFDYSELRLVKGKATFGRYADGKPATIDVGTSILIGGVPGSGKSSATWAILGSLLDTGVPTRVWALDPKGGVELAKMGERVGRNTGPLQVVAYEKDPRKADEFVDRFHGAMRARLAELSEAGQRKFRPTEDTPLNILVIDELLGLREMLKKGTQGNLAVVLEQGRAAGFIVLACTQLGKVTALGDIRDLFVQRLCFSVRTPEMATTIIGERVPAHKIALPAQAGVGYAYEDVGAVVRRFRAGFVDDAEAGRIAKGVPADGITALYRWYDAKGALLYVGITNDVARRTREHGKSSPWSKRSVSSTVERYQDRDTALQAERWAIELEQPPKENNRERIPPTTPFPPEPLGAVDPVAHEIRAARFPHMYATQEDNAA